MVDARPVSPDNLQLALLIDGLHPLTIRDTQKIRLRPRAVYEGATRAWLTESSAMDIPWHHHRTALG
ncbi:hypothetical protein [Paracoccus sp. (in: a-proteobacteria)]|uniref:hypothetical protein n=1 Tax=Paracoccus sp. TaxID=267 RepID=UPI002AFFB20A|nr:hypothetical protein [Paracoccus sp. (in: a-proteobacteria)]